MRGFFNDVVTPVPQAHTDLIRRHLQILVKVRQHFNNSNFGCIITQMNKRARIKFGIFVKSSVEIPENIVFKSVTVWRNRVVL
jgi:hypothetical protein